MKKYSNSVFKKFMILLLPLLSLLFIKKDIDRDYFYERGYTLPTILTEDITENSILDSQINLDGKDYCYIIVHAAWELYIGHPIHGHIHPFEFSKDHKERYGDYKKYLENLAELIRNLENSDDLVIFFAEERNLHNKIHVPAKEFQPFKNSFILFTYDGFPSLKPSIKIGDTVVKLKNYEQLFSFLEDLGIKEVRFAGEEVWSPFGASCLGGNANIFHENDFDARCVKDCIIPPEHPGYPAVYKQIYDVVDPF